MNSKPRVRKRPVSFGNPALGTYKGCVYTLEESSGGPAATLETPTHGGLNTMKKPLVEGAESVDRMVAMIDVPPEQVPEGVLNLARAHRPCIDHVRIVIADAAEKENEEGHDDDSPSFRHGTEEYKESDIAWPDSDEGPSRTYLVLFHLLTEEDAVTFVEDLHGRPYTSLDETVTCSVFTVVALQGEGGVSLMNPMFAPSTKSSHGALEILPSPSANPDEEALKSAALEANKTLATNAPSQSQKVEDMNCPVCLDKMSLDPSSEDKTSILTTVCNHTFHWHCLVQCQDSPCPVCRYDHSGLNEALSQCHICGTTERNYVCLICGVVSCVGNISMPPMPPAAAAMRHGAESALPEVSPEAAQQLHRSHAGQHYDQTLHAYALDTETQHVWDFAGQGYVHRLLQNKEDGKLVEGNDPNNTTSQERSLTPGLSDSQEGEVVHRKLEGFASQYYTLLKSQLEQQRAFYEGRLEEIRREFAMKKIHATNEQADLIGALKQERKQLAQRLVTLNRKKDKVSDDVAFLKSMNESLEANKAPLERKIQQVQRDQVESREMIQKYLPALEEKVTTLMLQLEESMNSTNGGS